MKLLDLAAMLAFMVMFFAVFGAFFDLITAKEAVVVLATFGVPLTLAKHV